MVVHGAAGVCPPFHPHNPSPRRAWTRGEAGRQAASSRSNSLLRDANVRAPHSPQTKSEELEQQGSPAPRGTGCHHPGGGRTAEVKKETPASATLITRQDEGAPPPGLLGWGGPLNSPEHMPKCYCSMGLSLPPEGITWFASSGPDVQVRVSAHLGRNTTAVICFLPAHVVLKSGGETVEDTRLTPFCRATGEPGDRRGRRLYFKP